MPSTTSKKRTSSKSTKSKSTSKRKPQHSSGSGGARSKRSEKSGSTKKTSTKKKSPTRCKSSTSKKRQQSPQHHKTIDESAPTIIDERPRGSRQKKEQSQAEEPQRSAWWRRLDRWFTIALVLFLFAGVGAIYGINKWSQEHGAAQIHSLSLSHLPARSMAFLTHMKIVWGPPTTKSHSLGYEQEIQASALRHKLRPALLKALIAVESKFRPHHVDEYGAMGLMQVTAAVAKQYKKPYEALTPSANIILGTQFLADKLQLHKNESKALVAFHYEMRGIPLPTSQEQSKFVKAVKAKEVIFLKDPGYQIRAASKNPPRRKKRKSRVKQWIKSIKNYLSSNKTK